MELRGVLVNGKPVRDVAPQRGFIYKVAGTSPFGDGAKLVCIARNARVHEVLANDTYHGEKLSFVQDLLDIEGPHSILTDAMELWGVFIPNGSHTLRRAIATLRRLLGPATILVPLRQ